MSDGTLRAQVLVVDDETDHAEAMAEALRKPGHVCTIVHSLAAAKEELLHGHFDVVVTDLVMETETAGLEVLRLARTEQPHQMTAWQRFLPGGPLAFLPLSDAHHCAVVWSLPEAEAGALGELDDAIFRQRLEQALESRLGAVAAVGARYAFSLRARHARDYCLPGLALIGDAAHSIHPLAGQGVNIGLQDAAVLAREMQAAAGSRLPLAHARVLSRYQRQRRGDNALTLHAMTGFQRLFGASDAMLRVLRNQGMRWFDRSGPLKRQVVRLATGR